MSKIQNRAELQVELAKMVDDSSLYQVVKALAELCQNRSEALESVEDSKSRNYNFAAHQLHNLAGSTSL
jgi:hypothetical protein